MDGEKRRCSEFWTHIGQDLVLEILTRLPDYQSLCSSAAVCKQWRSAISNPEFVSIISKRRQFASHSLPFSGTVLFRDNHTERVYPAIPKEKNVVNFFSDEPKILLSKTEAYMKFLPADSVVRASCKDLLVVQRLSPPKSICVCNPITRRWVPLPEPPPLPEEHDEDSRRVYACGIVFEPDSNRNYVVILIMTCTSEMMWVAVFRSETGRWDDSVRNFSPEPGLSRLLMTVGTSDGVVYTPLVEDNSLMVFNKIAAFDAFDVSSRLEYRDVSLPTGFKRGWKGSCSWSGIGVVRGRLRLWQAYPELRRAKYVFRVWQLNEKYEGWDRLHDFRLMERHVPHLRPTSAVVGLHPNDDDVFFFKDYGPNVWQYHIRTKKCEKVGEVNNMWPTAIAYSIVHQPWPTEMYEPRSF